METPRINQHLVALGLADSRRKADELIKQGKVRVNGNVLDNLSYRVQTTDEIAVNGKSGKLRSDIYVVYNKPVGEVCSHQHQGQSPIVFDNLPKSFSTLKIAGRLDKDSHGLVILSSDGEFVQQLSHPSQAKTKTYIVKTQQPLKTELIKQLNEGVKLDDGISVLKASAIKPNILRVELSEGRNRQIRRSLEALGNEVIDLERVSIGHYSNPHLIEGKFEFIKPEAVL